MAEPPAPAAPPGRAAVELEPLPGVVRTVGLAEYQAAAAALAALEESQRRPAPDAKERPRGPRRH